MNRTPFIDLNPVTGIFTVRSAASDGQRLVACFLRYVPARTKCAVGGRQRTIRVNRVAVGFSLLWASGASINAGHGCSIRLTTGLSAVAESTTQQMLRLFADALSRVESPMVQLSDSSD